MHLILLTIFLASLFSSFLYNRFKNIIATLLTITLVTVIIYFSTFINAVSNGETFYSNYSWIDSLGIHFNFYLDGLSLFFALLITGMGLLVLLYSFKYTEKYQHQNRFFSYLFLFMGSMLGLVLSANLISLFIFWELTSFSSFLLIGFNNHKESSRRAARQALLVTAGGGLALMSGFIFLEIITNSGYNLLEMFNETALIVNSDLHIVCILLIAIGAFSKSAQFPFHFWLPNAMAAPTPVSAYLHSATMVKAGVYLVFRLNPLFYDINLWTYLIGTVGAFTMVWGALKAIYEDDLKKILAYTTISALGIFFMMPGIGGKEAINAAMVYLLAHALYKGGLFLATGSIEHQSGTRKISELSGLVQKMPYTAFAVILLCASMAGIIPFIGFIGKESLYKALYHPGETISIIYLLALFIASALFTAVCIEIIFKAILKKGESSDKNFSDTGFLMLVAPLTLGILGIFIGLVPGSMAEPLLQWSAAAVYNSSPSMELKLWHGFNLVFIFSILTIVVGILIYLIRNSIRKFRKFSWLKADFIFDKLIEGIVQLSRFSTRTIQNGYLRNYLAMLIITFSIIMIYILLKGNFIGSIDPVILFRELQIYEVVIIALITVAVIFLFRTKSKLIVTATFGIIGYSLALAYTLFSAPDVAITQFLSETLTLILLILILHRLPSYTFKGAVAHKKYLPLAILFGVLMTIISMILLNVQTDSELKSYFLENSLIAGKGKNAVNVILTDFRGIDTLGEITVLTITMIGIIALLKIKSKK